MWEIRKEKEKGVDKGREQRDWKETGLEKGIEERVRDEVDESLYAISGDASLKDEYLFGLTRMGYNQVALSILKKRAMMLCRSSPRCIAVQLLSSRVV